MSEGVSYQNKDILFKILGRYYPRVSFKTYGLDLPAVKEVLPTDLPDISANEFRADGVFLLEDDSLLILEYESSAKAESILKYGHYAFRVLDRYWRTRKKLYNVIIAVIYTSDAESAPAFLHTDSLRIDVRQCFLRNIDGDAAVRAAREKLEARQALSDEDILRLIVAPLAKSTSPKQAVLEECVELAKGIEDERLQTFVITGLLVASDKFANREYLDTIRRQINMTKMGQIIQEEIEAAATAAAAEAAMTAAAAAHAEAAAREREIARGLLRDGVEPSVVMKHTGLTKADLERLLLN